jgi:hypothetical protein
MGVSPPEDRWVVFIGPLAHSARHGYNHRVPLQSIKVSNLKRDTLTIMSSQSSPSVSHFLPAAFILGISGWAGLFLLISYTLPTVGPRWLFFFLGVLALTGTALPIVAFLNRRFQSNPPAASTVIMRQSIWVGVYGATLAWLQIGRALTLSLGMLLALGLIVIEWLLRLRERSQWNP